MTPLKAACRRDTPTKAQVLQVKSNDLRARIKAAIERATVAHNDPFFLRDYPMLDLKNKEWKGK